MTFNIVSQLLVTFNKLQYPSLKQHWINWNSVLIQLFNQSQGKIQSFLFLSGHLSNLPIVSDVFLNVAIICLLKKPFRESTGLHRAFVQIEKHTLWGRYQYSSWWAADASRGRKHVEARLPWGGLVKAQASAGRVCAGFRSVASFVRPGPSV